MPVHQSTAYAAPAAPDGWRADAGVGMERSAAEADDTDTVGGVHTFHIPIPDDMDVQHEQFSMGLDWKLPGNGLLAGMDPAVSTTLLELGMVPEALQPTLIEYDLNDRWKSDGFTTAGPDGSIYGERMDGDGRGPVQRYLRQGVTKDGVHKLLGGFTPDQVNPRELDDDELVVRKDSGRDNGDGVSFHRAGDAPSARNLLRQDAVYERYVPGSITYNGVERAACGRAGVNVTVEPMEHAGQQYADVTVDNLDMYWRAADHGAQLLDTADDSDTLTAAGRANLAKGAAAVPATAGERQIVWEQDKRVVERLVQQWAVDSMYSAS